MSSNLEAISEKAKKCASLSESIKNLETLSHECIAAPSVEMAGTVCAEGRYATLCAVARKRQIEPAQISLLIDAISLALKAENKALGLGLSADDSARVRKFISNTKYRKTVCELLLKRNSETSAARELSRLFSRRYHALSAKK